MDIYVEERPWGKFEKYIENQKCTVKVLYFKPYSQTSLQYHHERDELWKVLEGKVSIIVGDTEFDLKQNDSTFIKRGEKHQIINHGEDSRILEISIGDFKETDIVRLKDIYNRVN
jgi:mannose-6-phosphate isomerase-like protein (cupin superfamily)